MSGQTVDQCVRDFVLGYDPGQSEHGGDIEEGAGPMRSLKASSGRTPIRGSMQAIAALKAIHPAWMWCTKSVAHKVRAHPRIIMRRRSEGEKGGIGDAAWAGWVRQERAARSSRYRPGS